MDFLFVSPGPFSQLLFFLLPLGIPSFLVKKQPTFFLLSYSSSENFFYLFLFLNVKQFVLVANYCSVVGWGPYVTSVLVLDASGLFLACENNTAVYFF